MKMRTKWQFLVASMAALAIAGSAQAEMIAGWDFSQYASDGSLDTDGDFVGEGTLSANYSTVIGGDNAGAAANPYGTMYINGQKGSSTTDYEFGFPAEFAASAGDLVNNKTRPVLAGGISQFETCSASDGQAFCLPLKMRAIASVNVVFEATLAPDGLLGEDWMLSFGGRTESTSQNVSVEFSTDATNWTSFGSLLLTSSVNLIASQRRRDPAVTSS